MDLSALLFLVLLLGVAGALAAALLALSVARSSKPAAPVRVPGASGIQHLAVKRYDAFGDMGGHLSWSLALLDGQGDGVVLTSIHGRSEARTYAKNVSGWKGDQQLSPEEEEAIRDAKAS